MRVLISAYACEPDKGSEPGAGWNWIRHAALQHEVWAITRENNRAAIESRLAIEPLPSVTWLFFDLPPWARFWKRGTRGVYAYYTLWQVGAYVLAKRLHSRMAFDLVHHVTFGTAWLPTLLAWLPVPFVWGPVGGAEEAPWSFVRTSAMRARAYERVRGLVRHLQTFNPLLRQTARRARVSLAKAPESATFLRRLGSRRIELVQECGLSEEEFRLLAQLPLRQGPPIRFGSVGRLLNWKGFHLGLLAFAELQKVVPDSEYVVIGDGPEMARLRRLASDLGISERVRFGGALPRSQVLNALADIDVLVHPSLHDSGGLVCPEAMAAARPVICLRLGGPALQVTSDTGFPIDAGTPGEAVRAIVAAMVALATDPPLRLRLGLSAQRRAYDVFRWEAKANVLRSVYAEAVSTAHGPLV